MAKKWYVLHTYTGYEENVKSAIIERMQAEGFGDRLGEILIPEEEVEYTVKGKVRTRKKKYFPGYIFIKVDISDERVRQLIVGTPRVTGFVGGASPQEVPEEEVARLTKRIEEGELKPEPKIEFEPGETVRVVEGPFTSFSGVVDDVKPEKKKLKVLVSIFGRTTPVELDFSQVEKT
ncbi:MAG TPA: transcription termination/antitermination factor NusG [Proteobacteria bacterium]|nr:transcription termination/antitermination factor NusG [Pseudomonadota bacterium]